MKGWYVENSGGLDAMQWIDLPMPEPGPGQVLGRVSASAVNVAETRMRSGQYGGQEAKFVLGMESAGTVEKLGPGVAGFAVGDRVFGRARGSHGGRSCQGLDLALHLPEGSEHDARTEILRSCFFWPEVRGVTTCVYAVSVLVRSPHPACPTSVLFQREYPAADRPDRTAGQDWIDRKDDERAEGMEVGTVVPDLFLFQGAYESRAAVCRAPWPAADSEVVESGITRTFFRPVVAGAGP